MILSESSINVDVVCLSETSQQSDHVYPSGTYKHYYYYYQGY